MPLSFSEILKEGSGRTDPESGLPGVGKAGAAVPPPPPVEAPSENVAEKRLLDDVLKEVIGEISQEIQRIGAALKSRDAPAPPTAPSAGELPPEPSVAPPLLEETLTAEERKALADLLREPAPAAPADPGNLPLGGFAPEEPRAETATAAAGADSGDLPEMPRPAPAAPPPEAPLPGGSGVWISPPAVQQALKVETDAGIMEVEDLIKIHMAAYAEEDRKDKEDQEKAGRAAAAAAGADLLAMVRPQGVPLLSRLDAWIVSQGWARHKRRAGTVAWAILVGTAIGVAVTLWMRR